MFKKRMSKEARAFFDAKSEKTKALEAIRNLVILAVVLFAFYGFFITAATMEIATQVRNFNACASVEDHEFTACYNKNK